MSLRIWLAGIAVVLGAIAIAWYYFAGSNGLPGPDAAEAASQDSAFFRKLSAVAETLSAPSPGEWRYDMHEPAQSSGDFVNQRWTRPANGRRTIYLVPLDPQPMLRSPDLPALQAFVSAYFGLPDSVLAPVQLDEKTLISRIQPATRKRQYLTDEILNAVERISLPDAFCRIGCTMRDLYPEPSWEYVFGQSSLTRRTGVVSFARFDPGDMDSTEAARLVLLRSCKVLAHETSHMFGLYHCGYFRCCMNGSNNLTESDAKPLEPCPICLWKLHYSIGFPVRERFDRLREFYQRAGLGAQMQDIDKRIKLICGE